MNKRKKLFNLAYLKNQITDNKEMAIIILVWILFVIACSTFAFIFFKTEPIALTESEIEYYTAQAELAYHQGIICVDNNVEFVSNHDGSFDVYGYKQPAQKQKLTVTFLEGGEVDTNPYYSYAFRFNRIGITLLFAYLGFVLYLPLAYALICIVEWFYKLASKKQK